MVIVVSRKLLRIDSVRQEIIAPTKLSAGDPTNSTKTTFATLSEFI